MVSLPKVAKSQSSCKATGLSNLDDVNEREGHSSLFLRMRGIHDMEELDMLSFEQKLDRYAELAVKVGANV